MKKIFFSAAMLFMCTLNSQADEILYDSGLLSANSAYVVPDWITVNSTVQTTVFKEKTSLDAAKIIAPFSTAIGLADGTTSAYALYLIRNDENEGSDPDVTMSLDLSSFDATSVYVQYWGTGSKSIKLATSNSSQTATGVNSYTAGEATFDVSTESSPITVTITPKAKNQSDASTGDTYINRIIIYGKAASTETTTWAETSGSGTGYSWSGTTLTLDNFTWTTSAATAMTVPDGTTIVLEGTNTVTSTCTNATSYGIKPIGKLTIRGSGSLTATGGNVTATGCSSYGIYMSYSSTIESGTITGIAGSAKGPSIGIYNSTLTISGGTVTGIGSTSPNNISVGIYGNIITVSGGSVIASAATSIMSSGFEVATSLNITGGSITASSPLVAIVVPSDPSVTATGGDNDTDSATLYWKSSGYTKTSGGRDYAKYAKIDLGVGTGINSANADSPIIRTEYYDINGKKLSSKPTKGFYIENNFHENGARTGRTMGAF